MESLSDAIDKKLSKTLYCFKGLVDPANTFGFDTPTIDAWNRLTLEEQRRMYLYCLYKKWRGEPFYGTPFEIISNCHPYPTNWNGKSIINRLMKENRMVRAKYDGSYGIYTLDEARVWQMTDVKPLNF
jgi:hypothetical protein